MAVCRTLKQIAPVRLRAEVVHGFGRGSRQLGFPTANMRIRWDVQDGLLTTDEVAVLDFAKTHETGIYCAYGLVEGLQGIYKVAMSMGWNPTFTDVKTKTIEPWILHEFAEDFYGHHLRLLVLGFVRAEFKFSSLDELIREIKADGEYCEALLDSPELARFRHDAFFQSAPAADAGSGTAGVALRAEPAAGRGGLPAGITVSSDVLSALRTAPPLSPGFARLLLVRHAEAVDNEQGRLCGGGSDSELTAHGRAQAERLAEDLASNLLQLQLDLVGSSPLRRAAESADAIAARFPGARRLALEGLREMAYGTLEGARIADVREQMTELAKSWRKGETSQRVGGDGESPEDVVGRTLRSVTSLLEGLMGCTVLVVCHSWVIKALIAFVMPDLGLPRLLEVPQRNCAVNILDFCCQDTGRLGERFKVLAVDLLPGEISAEGRL